MLNQHKAKVVVTGYGMVSSLGVHHDDIWAAISTDGNRQSYYDTQLASPFICHPAAQFDPLEFVDSKPYIRPLSRSQVHAMVAVSQALKTAGLAKDDPLVEEAMLIVACNDGNRDEGKDEQLYSGWFENPQEDLDQYLNQHFSKARPSTFLAQLPNIFATNIANYFHIGGESITFTGDELAGINAVDLAVKKIASGELDLLIVGGVADGTKEHLMLYAGIEDRLCQDNFTEVWNRRAE